MNIKSRVILFSAVILISACSTRVIKHPNPDLRTELLALMKSDQAGIHQDVADEKAKRQKLRIERLKQIYAEQDWPAISQVGKDGSQAAWLIVQHADDDRDFQHTALAAMKKLVKDNEVNLDNLAYLSDRLSMSERSIQIYGTQGKCDAGVFVPFQIENMSDLDGRRKAMNLPPMSDYIAFASRVMCKSTGH